MGVHGPAWGKRRTQGASPTAGGGLLSGSGGTRAALRLGVNSTPGCRTLCTQLSRGGGGGRLQLACGRTGVWPRLGGGTLGGNGLSVHRWTSPGSPTAVRATASSEAPPRPPQWPRGLADPSACGPRGHLGGTPNPEPTQDSAAGTRPPPHSLERDASPQSRPVPTSTPTLAPSPDTPLRPRVTERGATRGQGWGHGLGGALHVQWAAPGRPPGPGPDLQPRDSRVCCRPPCGRVKSWSTTGMAAPNCVPSGPLWSPPLMQAGSPGPRSPRVSCPSRPKPEGPWDGEWLIGLEGQGALDPAGGAGLSWGPDSSREAEMRQGSPRPQESPLHAEPWAPRQGWV